MLLYGIAQAVATSIALAVDVEGVWVLAEAVLVLVLVSVTLLTAVFALTIITAWIDTIAQVSQIPVFGRVVV